MRYALLLQFDTLIKITIKEYKLAAESNIH